MKKIKLILNESLVSNKDSDIIEDTTVAQKPDYQIIDITVIPDETYYPTIQSILIDLDESNKLKESEDSKLDINILSETVNAKTGYSNSLFEFESSNKTITLSLVLQESDRRGIYKVEAYTTRGVKVFESNTYKPKMVIESYLNSLANEYLIEKPLKEGEIYAYNSLKDMLKAKGKKLVHYTDPKRELGKDTKTQSVFNFSSENGGCPDSFKYYNDYVVVDDIKESEEDFVDTYIQKDVDPAEVDKLLANYDHNKICKKMGLDYESDFGEIDRLRKWLCRMYADEFHEYFKGMLADINEAEEPVIEDRVAEDTEVVEDPAPKSDPDDYSVEEFMTAQNLTDQVLSLNIDYSEWNDASQEERDAMVRPELGRFLNSHRAQFDKDPKLFDLLEYNLIDLNFHTEAKVLKELYRGGNR